MKPLLKEKRKKEGLLQKYIAKQIGVSQQTLSEWERGNGYPSIDKAYLLADLYRCLVDELYEREGKNERHRT